MFQRCVETTLEFTELDFGYQLEARNDAVSLKSTTPPKFNSEFTPEKMGGKGRRLPFLLGFGNFSGSM